MSGSPSDAVRVLCFGALRERLGTEIVVREKVTTVLDLWSLVTHDHPDFRDPQGRVRPARNSAYCDWQTPVEPGDEVAFMPPVAGGSVDEEAGPRLRAALVADPIDLSRLVAELRGDGDGAVAAFVGVVRDTSEGRPVNGLDYETYPPMADRELLRIAADVAERHGLSGMALVHRVGSLQVGEVSVAVVAAAPHRQAALLACSEAVEVPQARSADVEARASPGWDALGGRWRPGQRTAAGRVRCPGRIRRSPRGGGSGCGTSRS